MAKLIAVLRVRGSMETRGTVERTLRELHLTRKNHCVLVPESASLLGMLQLAKDFITWGEVDLGTVEKLLMERGEVAGGSKLADDYLQKNSKFKSISEFAKALLECTAKMQGVEGLKPLFRLHPPLKGFGGIKRPFPKGALGNRKEKINGLLGRML